MFIYSILLNTVNNARNSYTYAMLLAGLGLIGFMARRGKQTV